MPVAVSAHDLTKVFADGRVANKGVTLDIAEGEIFAILGPNGAGKTTFVRQVTTELLPTSGSILVFDIDVTKDARKVTPFLGVVPQEIQPYGDLTVYEHVYYLARLRGLSKPIAQEETSRVLGELELSDCRDKLVGLLSGGLKRRTILASALTGNAKLLVLDEPSSGLDPGARRNLWTVLRKKANEGRTILLTTHYVEEAEAIADRVAIFNNGSVVVVDKPEKIKSSVTGFVRLTLSEKDDSEGRDSGSDIAAIRALGFRDVKQDPAGSLMIRVRIEEKELIPSFYEWALRNKLDVRLSPITLEDAYLELLR